MSAEAREAIPFYVRRALQPIERRDITVNEGTRVLDALVKDRGSNRSGCPCAPATCEHKRQYASAEQRHAGRLGD